jgi:hypothetical protein
MNTICFKTGLCAFLLMKNGHHQIETVKYRLFALLIISLGIYLTWLPMNIQERLHIEQNHVGEQAEDAYK